MTTLTVELDREQARNAVGAVSVALGAAAVLAPRTTAGAFGVRAGGALPLLGGGALLPFLSVAGGVAADVFGLWDGRALRPLALGLGRRLYAPSSADAAVLRRAA